MFHYDVTLMTLSCDVTSSAQRRDKILFNERISSVDVEDDCIVSLSLLCTYVGTISLLGNDTDVEMTVEYSLRRSGL